MSHIFDALRLSEAARSAANNAANATAGEVPERAEHQALFQWVREALSTDNNEPGSADAKLRSMPRAIRPDEPAKEPIASSMAARDSERAKILGAFQTIEISRPAENRLVCLADRGSPAAEAFRLLIVRLRHLRKDRPLRKVLITSTVPQEGKSFTAANLACALAVGSQEKILLVEGDLRRPTLGRLFGMKAERGICEYMRGEQGLESSIYRLSVPGIWLFPSGSAEGDPLEIIQSSKMPPLMAQLADLFDWIVIDSPPMLPLADTTALARLADGILLVARRDITEKRKLKKGLEALESDKLIGALLNSSNSAADKDYYYYRHPNVTSEKLKVTR